MSDVLKILSVWDEKLPLVFIFGDNQMHYGLSASDLRSILINHRYCISLPYEALPFDIVVDASNKWIGVACCLGRSSLIPPLYKNVTVSEFVFIASEDGMTNNNAVEFSDDVNLYLFVLWTPCDIIWIVESQLSDWLMILEMEQSQPVKLLGIVSINDIATLQKTYGYYFDIPK